MYIYTILSVFFLFDTFTCLLLNKWSITNSNGTVKLVNIHVPTDVYTALQDSSIISDPLKKYGDITTRWVAYDNWTFSSEPFVIDNRYDAVVKFPQLDTNPAIYFNAYSIPSKASQFVTFQTTVPASYIRAHNNTIKIHFTSPVLLAESQKQSHPSQYVVPNCWPSSYHGECYINRLRKMQASFGWDWGPAIPTMGIRGSHVQVDSKSTTRVSIQHVRVLTNASNNCRQWNSSVNVTLDLLSPSSYSDQDVVCVEVTLKMLKYTSSICRKFVQSNKNIQFNFDVSRLFGQGIKLWWPRDLGEPNLYKLVARVLINGVVMDTWAKYIGFRWIQLVDESLKSSRIEGSLYEVRVNCRQVYLRGVNYVPRTMSAQELDNQDTPNFLLYSSRMANVNVIRVWGGGQIESEHFYNVADNLGILVWHDLLFACAAYPADDPEFMAGTREEVEQMVAQLQHHPSIALWAGNNEGEAVVSQGWYDRPKMNSGAIDRYNLLFNKLIKSIVMEIDPYSPYVTSSPSNGKKSLEEGGVSRQVQNPLYGDVHFYLYEGALWNASSYPITRMTTEFGFQSLPSIHEWTTITTDGDVNDSKNFDLNGSMMNHRQHSPLGMKPMVEAVKRLFGKLYPFNTTDPKQQYRYFSYLSQVNQALILETYIDLLRSQECTYNTSSGRGFNRGVIVWQLNDIWTAPTWSTISHSGRWKLAHYRLVNLYSPSRVILHHTPPHAFSITLSLPSFTISPLTSYRIEVHIYDFSTGLKHSLDPLQYTHNTTDCNTITIVDHVPIPPFLVHHSTLVQASLFVKNPRSSDYTSVSQDELFFPSKPEEFIKTLPQLRNYPINIRVAPNNSDPSVCLVTLTTVTSHLWVTLDLITNGIKGYFSENGFHMLGNEITKNVTFNPWYPIPDDMKLPNTMGFINCSKLKFDAISLNDLK